MSKRSLNWHYYALGTIGLWASAYVFTKVALNSFSPVPLGLLRCAVASAALLTILAFKKELWPPLRAWPEFILSGAVGFALYLILFNRGAGFLSATTSCIVISISPILTAFMGAALFKERLPAPAWGGGYGAGIFRDIDSDTVGRLAVDQSGIGLDAGGGAGH